MGWGAIVQGALGMGNLGLQSLVVKEQQKLMEMNSDILNASADSDIFAGLTGLEMAGQESSAILLASELEAMDSVEAGYRVEKEGYEFSKYQKMMYIASGVQLSGSPLLVLEKTITESQADAKDLLDKAESVRKLGEINASRAIAMGRAKMTGAVISANSKRIQARMDMLSFRVSSMGQLGGTALGGAGSTFSAMQFSSKPNAYDQISSTGPTTYTAPKTIGGSALAPQSMFSTNSSAVSINKA